MSIGKKLRIIFSAIAKHPLAKRHKITAYFTFFRWQLSQIIFPGIRKVKFIGDTYLLANKGMTGATGNIYCGLHEFEDMGFLLHFLSSEDTFIDIGANIGSYTILASGVCGAKTIAFEPVPETFVYLENNIKVNGIAHLVSTHNEAVGAAAGKLKFTSGLDTVNHVLSGNEICGSKVIEVNVNTLDSKLENNHSTLLVKIDAEGFETEVLNGMERTLNDKLLKAIIIELNGSGMRYGYSDKNIHAKLLANNFLPYQYDPFTRKLSSLNTFLETNTIYLRDYLFVEQRVTSAKKITVFSETF